MPRTILVVEDRADRRAWFYERHGGPLGDQNVMHFTDDPNEAIRILGQEPVDLLCLDHDLNREPLAGRNVALWLIAHPEILPHLETVTHTVNVVSGPKIVAEMQAAGRPCVWQMFGFEPGQAEVLKAAQESEAP
jgi:CheY-like chemotaxis protein